MLIKTDIINSEINFKYFDITTERKASAAELKTIHNRKFTHS